jgi:ABC-2 type transport system ATP-binding protein
MIQIENLHFGYSKNRELFSGLDLKLQKGRVYGLLGKNGSGKTSLIKLMSGLRYPDSGKIFVNEWNPQKRQSGFLSDFYLIPEEFEAPSLSLRQFLKITKPFYPDFNNDVFWEYMSEFKMENVGNLSELSYGEKKKVLISFGLATNTPVMFLDEPTNGLDIPSKRIFRRIMASAASDNRLFIISTHQVKDLEGIIDSVLVLNNGKIVFNGSLESVSEVLSFRRIQKPDDRVLYADRQLSDYQVIMKKKEGEEDSRINLELLFNSIIEPDSKVVKLFDN